MSSDSDSEKLEYKIIERIQENFDCSLLVVCAQHLILCQEKRLQCYDFHGLKVREWTLDALIRYIKVIGGPPGRESILVGLKNGEVQKIFVDNPFAVRMLKINSSVRCLDISVDRKKLAVVDEHATCLVFDIKTGEILYQEPNANSVAWNAYNSDLLCFSGNGALSIKAREFVAYQQRMQGFVVGFSGKRVFCLHLYAMTSLEVPLSNQLYQYLERNMFRESYELACLGATESDWRMLAMAALHNFNLDIAKRAFHRIRNTKFLQLIYDIEQRIKRGETDNKAHLADILAYDGNFDDAAKLYLETQQEQKALDMFTDLRMFDRAQHLLSSATGETQKQLIRKRAHWAENSNDVKTAADMYMSAGDYDKAISIMIQHNFVDSLISLSRRLTSSDVIALRSIGDYFIESNEYTVASEIFTKLNDLKSLVKMYVHAQLWDDAFAICQTNPQFRDDVYLPYARWLAENDRFEEAQKAYHKAGRDEEASRVLEQLTENAVKESRFTDAGYYYWMLSTQYLDKAKEDEDDREKHLVRFNEYQQLADAYYAYHVIHRYLAEPFTSYQPEALLNIARFVLNHMNLIKHTITDSPRISLVAVLYTLAKQGNLLGGYKLARHAYERLQTLRAPARFQEHIDLGSIKIRGKPFHDNEDLLPTCYRCGLPSPLIASGDVLPLVEFRVTKGISDKEARDLINAEPPLVDDPNRTDPFAQSMPSEQNSALPPIVLDRDQLLVMNRAEVVICEWSAPLHYVYYRNLIPEISVSKCNNCHRVFHTDDFELAVLQEGRCPFCRSKDSPQLRGNGIDEELDE